MASRDWLGPGSASMAATDVRFLLSHHRADRARRSRQDHPGRCNAARHRGLCRARDQGRPRPRFQRPGTRARHHHPGQGSIRRLERGAHQSGRYAGPRRLRGRGRAGTDAGRRRPLAGRRLRRPDAANPIRALQGPGPRASRRRRDQQGRPARRPPRRGGRRGVRAVLRLGGRRRRHRVSHRFRRRSGGSDHGRCRHSRPGCRHVCSVRDHHLRPAGAPNRGRCAATGAGDQPRRLGLPRAPRHRPSEPRHPAPG